MNNIVKEKKINIALYITFFVVASILCFTMVDKIKNKRNNLKKNVIENNKEREQDAIPVLKDTTYSYIAPSDKKKLDKTNKKNQIVLKTDVKTNEIFDNKDKIKINNKNESSDKNLFMSFDENTNKMSWPAFGEVIMDFSKNNLIYDKTLEQYRTNESISISSQFGDQVKCVADGLVKLVSKTDEDGNLIIIDHGNNWSTMYSQLQDGILVNQGDLVKRSQVIAGVNTPTKHSVLLGTHLDFKVIHNDDSINPKSVLTTLSS